MTTFEMWWIEEVGHPPTDEREHYAFEVARKLWIYRDSREPGEHYRPPTKDEKGKPHIIEVKMLHGMSVKGEVITVSFRYIVETPDGHAQALQVLRDHEDAEATRGDAASRGFGPNAVTTVTGWGEDGEPNEWSVALGPAEETSDDDLPNL